MSQPRQSRALVIVNTDFRSSDGDVVFGTRRGAKREAEKLSNVLSRLNYKVKLMHNKTAKEIEDLYQQECCCEHGEYFVSVISSHGKEGVIFGCDSEPVKLTRIFQILSSEKCLAPSKIPKIFFIQACRGAEFDQGVVVECDSGEPKPDFEPDCFADYLCIPPQTVVMFACSPGKGKPLTHQHRPKELPFGNVAITGPQHSQRCFPSFTLCRLRGLPQCLWIHVPPGPAQSPGGRGTSPGPQPPHDPH
ncbi:caspase-3-like [Accipiter gentilis]|uniref:caspase-3-like n=1 Tax=Astur gentilis TaxID=8957 RepID=UPI0021102E0C|nr:caspase-3-like [Accipiter gentilis]